MGVPEALATTFRILLMFSIVLVHRWNPGVPEGSSALKKFKVGQNFEKIKVGLQFQNYFQSPFSEFFSKLGSEKAMRGGTPLCGAPGGVGVGFLGWGAGFFWGVPRVFIDALDR